MEQTAAPRPLMVTGACVYFGAVCGLQTVKAVRYLITWNSDWFRERLAWAYPDVVNPPPGTTHAEALAHFRVTMIVLAVVSLATILMAWLTAKGNQGARLAVTVFGVWLASSVFSPNLVFVVLGAFAFPFLFYLWNSEARQWFGPLKHNVTRPAGLPSYYSTPRGSMPGSVLAAGTVTLTLSTLAALPLGGIALLYVVAPQALSAIDTGEKAQQGGGSGAGIGTAVFAVDLVMLVLALAAITAASLTLAGLQYGRNLLVGLAIVTLLLLIPGLPLALPWMAGAAATLVLLARPRSRQWFDERDVAESV